LSAFGLGQKKINNILNQEDQPGSASRLEQLLSDEETIAECKQQNQRLVDFLGKKENLKLLIKYATRAPEDPNNKTQAFK
jgi:hypothetical protein